jgi:hypothetical protein
MRWLCWLLLLLLCLGGIGLYLGWFSFSKTSNDIDNGKTNISVSVDKNKIKAVARELKEKVKEEIKELKTHTK